MHTRNLKPFNLLIEQINDLAADVTPQRREQLLRTAHRCVDAYLAATPESLEPPDGMRERVRERLFGPVTGDVRGRRVYPEIFAEGRTI